jgi:hypothetical protein
VHYLSFNSPTRLSLSSLTSILDFISARLGINEALDSVIERLCTTYYHMLAQDDGACKNDVKQYSKALTSLRMSLRDGREAFSSEVLYSIALLSWYEV